MATVATSSLSVATVATVNVDAGRQEEQQERSRRDPCISDLGRSARAFLSLVRRQVIKLALFAAVGRFVLREKNFEADRFATWSSEVMHSSSLPPGGLRCGLHKAEDRNEEGLDCLSRRCDGRSDAKLTRYRGCKREAEH